ncbi:MAG: prolyl-tRNA synthetase associated domain-containing protein [Candidatus Aminicenantales bacterium]|jgi:Ala-tRNA(Pro) deacylase
MAQGTEQHVYDALAGLGIAYARREHPPVFTVEEAAVHWEGIPGAHCKNLFLRNKKGNRHYLVIAECSKRLDLRALARLFNDDRLSFASDVRMMRYLGLQPGAVSPFGLLQDEKREVIVVLDEDLKPAEAVSFHPNVNTATLTITYSDLEKFLAWRGNAVRRVRL